MASCSMSMRCRPSSQKLRRHAVRLRSRPGFKEPIFRDYRLGFSNGDSVSCSPVVRGFALQHRRSVLHSRFPMVQFV